MRNKQQKCKYRVSKGKFWVVFPLVLVTFLLVFVVPDHMTAKINYSNNSAVEEEFSGFSTAGYIEEQSKTSDFRFGVRNSRYNGCGWIATYNACKYLGVEMSIAEIINYYDVFGSNIYGLLGTNPFAIKDFFERQGRTSVIVFDEDKFDEIADASEVCIIAYVNFRGGHYQMLTAIGDGVYEFHNPYYHCEMGEFLRQHDDAIKFMIAIQ